MTADERDKVVAWVNSDCPAGEEALADATGLRQEQMAHR